MYHHLHGDYFFPVVFFFVVKSWICRSMFIFFNYATSSINNSEFDLLLLIMCTGAKNCYCCASWWVGTNCQQQLHRTSFSCCDDSNCFYLRFSSFFFFVHAMNYNIVCVFHMFFDYYSFPDVFFCSVLENLKTSLPKRVKEKLNYIALISIFVALHDWFKTHCNV